MSTFLSGRPAPAAAPSTPAEAVDVALLTGPVGVVPPVAEPAEPADVADAERIRRLETEIEQLRTAMTSRASIEQAKGILMLLTGCGDQGAFDLLAHISSHTHRKVREVANAITQSAAGNGALPDDVALILRDACPPARGAAPHSPAAGTA